MKTKKITALILSILIILGCMMCPASAVEPQEGIIHNIAEKYSSETLADDPNMPWFISDLAVYEQVYERNIISDSVKQACVDKIIADADETTYPSVLAKSIIALRAMGYDAKNVINAELETIDIAKKLTDLVDSESASVTNEYTLPYIIIALQQGNDYASDSQMDYLISTAIETKTAWQSTVWGTDAATPMLLALAPYYDTNVSVKEAIDETIPLVTAFQDETGLISNAASHGLAMCAFSALGIDNNSVINNGKNMFDGIMTQASETFDGFEPSYNSFSTEQGFRGLLSALLPQGVRIYEFADFPYNTACATGVEYAPVTFDVTPSDAQVEVEGAEPESALKYDLPAGSYNYSVYHSVYQRHSGTLVISPEEAEKHIPKTVSVTLLPNQSPGVTDNSISVKVKVMYHDKDSCGNSFTYKYNATDYKVMASETVTIKKGQSVFDALKKLLNKNNISYVENGGYVSEINNIKEFEHGSNSGWMFTVDGKHSNTGSRETILADRQSVVWFYTDNYHKERGSENFGRPSDDAVKEEKEEIKWGLDGKNPDIKKNDIVDKDKTFEDIKEHKNREAIEALAKRKVISGKDGKNFSPDEEMTRAEFATIIVNGLGLPVKNENPFNDVKENDWFFDYVNTAYSYGIILGVSENEFNPQGIITKEEASVMIARASALCGHNTTISNYRNVLSAFSDYKDASDWANDALAFCYKNKLLSDESLTIDPLKSILRGEVALLVYNMLLVSELL